MNDKMNDNQKRMLHEKAVAFKMSGQQQRVDMDWIEAFLGDTHIDNNNESDSEDDSVFDSDSDDSVFDSDSDESDVVISDDESDDESDVVISDDESDDESDVVISDYIDSDEEDER